MSVTIMEVLQGAKINLVENKNSILAYALGSQQLANVVELLEKGYSLDDDFDTVMGDAETVEDVTEKQDEPTEPTEEEAYHAWKVKLIEITAQETGRHPSEIKVLDYGAKEWFNSGATPYQCFRETYQIENDAS